MSMFIKNLWEYQIRIDESEKNLVNKKHEQIIVTGLETTIASVLCALEIVWKDRFHLLYRCSSQCTIHSSDALACITTSHTGSSLKHDFFDLP